MRRGIPVRRSRVAGLARLCGGFSLPVLALGVVGVRAGFVPQTALQSVLIVGFAIALAALGLALYSLADIWNSGAEGARSAIAAILYVSPVLVILGLVAAAAIFYPRLTDIVTDVDDPPLFTTSGAPLRVPDEAERATQRKSYPEIVPHLYPLPPEDVYGAVRAIVEARGWAIGRDVPPTPAEVPPEGALPLSAADAELLAVLVQTSSTAVPQVASPAQETPPETRPDNVFGTLPIIEPEDAATIEALAPTPVFGFLDDVVLRLRSTSDGTQVDMRSASRVGEHDLGQNARRISSFFAELDAALQPDPGTASQ